MRLPGTPVNATRPSRAPRSRLAGRHEAVVERHVVVELALGRVEAEELRAPSLAERTAEPWLVDETPRARLELVLRPEQEPGDAVRDERAVALDVGGEDGSADRHRLEHGVGHAALGRGRVDHGIRGLEQPAHLRGGHGAEVAGPRTPGDLRQERLTLDGLQDRPRVEEPSLRPPGDEPVEGGERQARPLHAPDARGEEKEDPVGGERPPRGEVEGLPVGSRTLCGTTATRAITPGSAPAIRSRIDSWNT